MDRFCDVILEAMNSYIKQRDSSSKRDEDQQGDTGQDTGQDEIIDEDVQFFFSQNREFKYEPGKFF